ncbi:MAG: CBS domain-containing protein [bacterium]|nr:CBS domain-containing protein [bacterium]
MIKVKDIMTKQVITCQAQTAIKEAARLMRLNSLTGLPVLAEDKLVGIVTEADLVKLEGPLHIPTFLGVLGSLIYLDNPVGGDEIQKQLETLSATTVDKLMTADVVTITSEATVQDAAELFLHHQGNPIPVVDSGKLVGIISRADIVKLIAGEIRPGELEKK